MGNSVQTDKIMSCITDLTESSDLNEDYWKSQFQLLIHLIGGLEIEENDALISMFTSLIKQNTTTFTQDNICNWFSNSILYHSIITDDNPEIWKPIITIIQVFIKSIIAVNNDSLFNLTINNMKTTEKSRSSNSNHHHHRQHLFPFNVIKFLIEDCIIAVEKVKNKEKRNYILNKAYLILHCLWIKCVNNINTDEIQYIDALKIFILHESNFSTDTLRKFMERTFITWYANINYSFIYGNTHYCDEMIFTQLFIIKYFFTDTNSSLFNVLTKSSSDAHAISFESEQNKIIFEFISSIDHKIGSDSGRILNWINDYKENLRDILSSVINTNLLIMKDLIDNIFTNMYNCNVNFKSELEIFLLIVLDISPDILTSCNWGTSTFNYLQLLHQYNKFTFFDILLYNNLLLQKELIAEVQEVTRTCDSDSDNNVIIQWNNQILKVIRMIRIFSMDNRGDFVYCWLQSLMNLTSYVSRITCNDIYVLFFEMARDVFHCLTVNRIDNTEQKYVLCMIYSAVWNIVYSVDQPSWFLLKWVQFYDCNKNAWDEVVKWGDCDDCGLNEKNKEVEILVNKSLDKIREGGGDINYSTEVVLLKILNKMMIFKDTGFKYTSGRIKISNDEFSGLWLNCFNGLN